ncbi:MAG: hypothetical protein HWN81_01110 [Candidatus Lokiarchaeota archaeon]|nr:hypothetical protein [Candidatus Lokiarchaeota archaeon]
MNEKNNKNHYLSLKDIISESLLRDLILFTFLFLLIITQAWDNILLLLFPLTTYTFSLFFRILGTNKKKTLFENSLIIYNPLGIEETNANRLLFSTMFQLILIFWLGAESLYNPIIVNSYLLFFKGFLIFFYTFAFFWIFIDIWKYTRIEILTDTIKAEIDSHSARDLRNIISFLQLKNFKLTSLINFFVFIILNILNLIFNMFINNNLSFGVQFYLPGSQLITFSYFFYGILIIPPVLSLILFSLNYKAINNFNREKLDKIIEALPRNLQVKIIENLKALNNKIKKRLNIE